MIMGKDVFVLVATHPEAITPFRGVNRLRAERDRAVTVFATARHRQLCDPVLKLDGILLDAGLNVMTVTQFRGALPSQLGDRIVKAALFDERRQLNVRNMRGMKHDMAVRA